MKLAIMQPYFLPYLGYFQLIHSVDKFVIYDDVQFIKGGWINRNQILVNSKASMFTLRIKKDSFTAKINERQLVDNYKYENGKILKSIELAYSRAPYYNEAYQLIYDILCFEELNLSLFIINSLKSVCNYIGINTEFQISSHINKNDELKGQDKVIDICHGIKANQYINAIGGMSLYSKKFFEYNDIELKFIKCKEYEYEQFKDKFVPNLSIIDLVMFNSKEKLYELINNYELI
ncbi:WbqC family protein [Clostridium sp. 19966]|uniref:WbqC family protein n=1 Tax=Clostridium sp. 19966 TaxID=2768166 RepID=UPI0028DFF4DC|nr:WbqC family protein [Clostridium sp. 19966]MDT8716142.1 WbqC family protein [Clostridium sp. 19966]